VAVAVAGRLVGVGGIGLSVGVNVAIRVGVSVGRGVAVGDGSTSTVGVAVHVGVTEGLGVLVGVAVTVGAGATKESRGHVQLSVANTVAAIVPNMAILALMGPTRARPGVGRLPLDGRSIDLTCIFSLPWDERRMGRLRYLLDSKVMFVNWPASLQLTMSTCSSSERGTGLPWLPTTSRTKG
jgi:hypothetical protein